MDRRCMADNQEALATTYSAKPPSSLMNFGEDTPVAEENIFTLMLSSRSWRSWATTSG